MNKKKIMVGDFETTVYEGQTETEVWASAVVELYTEDVVVLNSIEQTWQYLIAQNCDIEIFYHNLKFDGNFWLSFLMYKLKLPVGLERKDETLEHAKMLDNKYQQDNTYTYCISSMGQWYFIRIKYNGYTITIKDSLKLLPFSVKKLGKDFETKHRKTEIEYKGKRFAGCTITQQEREYIANDVLVVKEALEFMFSEGHNKLTIGACCLAEYRKLIGRYDYADFFPNLYEIGLQKQHTYLTAGDWIHKSYKGGWCYVVKGKENKIFNKGLTADVNSLYPSVMSGESGNMYPIGIPHFWTGNYLPEEAVASNKYYFIRIRTRFYIKKGYLPTVQIKGTYLYKHNEFLETSDVYDPVSKKYCREYIDTDGNVVSSRVELTMTMTDYELFLEHYNVEDFEIVDGCWFWSQSGKLLFDPYIDKYKKIKTTSTGSKRTLAKLYLNNLYGKMASSMDSSFKVAIDKDGIIGFTTVREFDKIPGYIAIGSAITSYARNFTIRAAQKNYHGVDKPGFIYADTDSIHCDLDPSELVDVPVHNSDFCKWKIESCWDKAIFVRQKTYIEHVVMEDMEEIEEPYYNIKCAGMPDKCKNLFDLSLRKYEPTKDDNFTEEELEVINKHYEISDFKTGLKIPGKLMPKRIKGGVILVDTYYELRN